MKKMLSKVLESLFDWWKRNIRGPGKRVDTSRVTKLAVMFLVVVFCGFAGLVYGIQAIQFLSQWLAGSESYQLMLTDETNKNLAVIVGIIAGAVGIDYRMAQFLRGKNGK